MERVVTFLAAPRKFFKRNLLPDRDGGHPRQREKDSGRQQWTPYPRPTCIFHLPTSSGTTSSQDLTATTTCILAWSWGTLLLKRLLLKKRKTRKKKMRSRKRK